MSTVAWITTRGLLGRRRFLLLLPLPILMVGIALIPRFAGATPEEWTQPVIVALGFTTLLPVVALIVGTGVLGAEIDDGTITHILSKPIPRWRIVLPKLLVAIGVTAATAAVPFYIVGALASGPRLGLGLVVGSTVGAILYSTIFVALSLVSRRPVLLGLVYVIVWEGLLSNLVSGTRVLSVQQYALAIADKASASPLLNGNVSVTVAIVMSIVVTVLFLVLAIRKLGSFSVTGETS
ncbi:ABC transporter permease [Asanoa sp. WMMD1127]|uniref:ABC transporter permease n=1 Tax=Asanoa sp. WMMD1127 TaxID=3016107 RepID=UPI002417B78A|nr:ABC transporter permease [Asanoa sp. WMMD1127]MDG4821038.1 ABC transporter permease [Asanoa sp. WMMD1127]